MVPRRTCVGCRRTAPVSELVRVARRDDGTLIEGRRAGGRGAWLCGGSLACLEDAARRGAFDRAFRAPVGPSALEDLRTQFGLGGPDGGGERTSSASSDPGGAVGGPRS